MNIRENFGSFMGMMGQPSSPEKAESLTDRIANFRAAVESLYGKINGRYLGELSTKTPHSAEGEDVGLIKHATAFALDGGEVGVLVELENTYTLLKGELESQSLDTKNASALLDTTIEVNTLGQKLKKAKEELEVLAETAPAKKIA